jgi:alkaline phosphatase D
MPKGPDMQLYRRLRYGNLAEFNVLDTRQYRDDQACGDGLRVDCEERLDPSRTMLGDTQEKWLLDGLGSSTATWNVLANQVFVFQADHSAGPEQALPMDPWDGYAAARERLFSGVRERGAGNFVVITGDAHRSVASDLKQDFNDPDSATVGAEFLGTSISSGRDGADMDRLGEIWLQENPHMKFHNAQRGYVRCVLTPGQWRSDYRVVPYVTQPGAPVSTRASAFVEAGTPGIQQIEESAVRGQRFTTTVEPPDYLDERQKRQWRRQQQRRKR